MASARELQPARILVVDDDEDIAVVAGLALESRGHSLTLVENGFKAIEAAKESVFDLLIVDLKMPGVSGADTIREIRTFRPDVPVIVITGSLNPWDEGIGDEVGFCLFKPFRVNELREAVEEVLGGQRQAEAGGRKRHIPPATKMAGKRVLVVDEDEDMLTIIRSELEHRGYQVTAVASGADAAAAAEWQLFNLLVTNMNLPNTGGQKVIERVRRFRPGIPIIVVFGSPEVRAEAAEMGVGRFLAKPFRTEALRSMVEEALGEE